MSTSMKNVIVTGASGFIGKAVVKELQQRIGSSGRVLGLSSRDVDLINRQALFDYFDRLHWVWEPTHIIHLAAVYKAGGWPATHPGTQFHANMAININLLEAWKRFFPKARLASVIGADEHCQVVQVDLDVRQRPEVLHPGGGDGNAALLHVSRRQ